MLSVEWVEERRFVLVRDVLEYYFFGRVRIGEDNYVVFLFLREGRRVFLFIYIEELKEKIF